MTPVHPGPSGPRACPASVTGAWHRRLPATTHLSPSEALAGPGPTPTPTPTLPHQELGLLEKQPWEWEKIV